MKTNIKAVCCTITKIETNLWSKHGIQRLYFTCYNSKGVKAGSNKYPYSGYYNEQGISALHYDHEMQGWKEIEKILCTTFKNETKNTTDDRPDFLKSKEDNDY